MKSQPELFGTTETYSRRMLDPVWFRLINLEIAGLAGEPPPPYAVSPEQSPFIVARNELFVVEATLEFNQSPLAALLMCLGTKISVNFAFEGLGGRATEVDARVEAKTSKNVYTYKLQWRGTAMQIGATEGLYTVSAVANIGPVLHECADRNIYGYGYLTHRLVQFYGDSINI